MTARTGAITAIATGGYGGRANSLRPASGQLSGVAALSAAGILSGPVKLLMHFNGANASTTFIDSSYGAHTVTPHGAAQLSTAQELFGTASGYFGTSSDYLTLDSATDFTFGTGDFTLDFWVMRDSTTVPITFIDFTDGSTPNAPKIYYDAGTLRYACMGADKITATVTLSVNTGYRISVARVGIATRMFLNGTQVGSTYIATDNLPCAAAGPTIGATALQFDATTVAWAAAVVTAGGTVSTPRKVLVDALIVGLKTDGVWTILDHLWIPAAENTQSALIDLVALTQATAVNSPTFTTDKGYAGNGSTSYINTTFDPTVGGTHNFVLNSAMMAVWNNTSRSTDNTSITGINDGNEVADLLPHTAAWGTHGFGMRVNDNATSTFPINGACAGFYLGQRISSSLLQGLINGVSLGTYSQASVAMNAQNCTFYIGGRSEGGGFGVGTTDQFSVAAYGGALTTTQAVNFSYRVMTYMDGLGLFLNRWVAAVVAAGGTVSSGRKTLVGNLISGLIADKVWGKLDRLYILAAENSQSALIDLVALAQATNNGSASFVADQGYDVGVAGSNLGFNYNNGSDAINYSLNNAHCGVWDLRGGVNVNPLLTDTPGSTLEMYIHYVDGGCYTRINDGGGGSVPIVSSAGWVAGDRGSSTTRETYLNGTFIGSVTAGVVNVSSLPTVLYVGGGAAVSFGGSLTATDHANLAARILTYMNSIDVLATMWVNAVVTAGGTVSSGRKTLVQALITGLIADGLWNKLDALWLLAGENSQSALVDIKGLMLATASNSPIFNTDRGYTFDGSTNYVDMGISPTWAPLSTLNSAHASVWASVAGNHSLLGVHDGSEGYQIAYTTSWEILGPNDTTQTLTGVASPSTGLATISRTASNARAMYINGSSIYSDTVTSTQEDIGGGSVIIGALRGFGNTPFDFSTGQISAATFGAGLTATDAANLNSRLSTYMASIGLLTANLAQYWVNAVVAAGGTVSSGRQTLVQALINGLVSDGVWAKLDRLFLFAGENSQSALIDLVHLASATAVSSPTFTTDRGYAVNGTSYVNTGFGGFSGGNYGIDAASYGDWIMTAGTGGANAIFMGAFGSKNSFLALDGSSNYGVLINDNSGTYLSASTAGTSTGFVMGSRTSSTQIDIYYNGSNVGSGSHVDAQPFQPPFFVGCRNNNGSPDAGNPHSSSAAFIGGGLTGTDASNLYLRLRTYMTAVGVP